MRKFLLVALLIFNVYNLYAQNKSGITGIVIDSATSKPMELVTIGITHLKDSTFVSYTSTTKTGVFSLSGMPSEQSLIIIASNVGYANFVKVINLKKGETLDLGKILMSTNATSLKEVVISGQRPAIVINKDTVEFNVEAFKVRPNAVVEELLKKLPGVQVDNDGSIKVNGRDVSKLTIDGKEFFSNDLRVATKNLDAALLDKVQIFDDRENDPDHLIEDSKVNKIINLKFKKAFKKSIFGKVYGGGGTRNRFESGALLNMFKDTLQLSVISIGNNLNKTGFSSNDLSQLGGFNRSGQNSLYNGSVPLGGNTSSGIEKIFSGGFNLNYDYGKKLKMNLIYFYSNSMVKSVSSSTGKQFLTADTLYSSNSYNSDFLNNKHAISGLIRWKPDSTTTLNYTPRINISNEERSTKGIGFSNNKLSPLVQTIRDLENDVSRMQFQHTFNYNKALKKKGESISITHSLAINPDQTLDFNNLNLISQTAALKSEIVQRLTNNRNRNTSANADFNYRYPISKKITGNLELTARYNYDERKQLTYDKNLPTGNYDLYLDDQSSDLNRNQWMEGAKAGISYQVTKRMQVDINISGEFLQLRNRFNKNLPDAKPNYFNVLPSASVRLRDFSVGYNTSVSQPSLYNIQPITIHSSQLYAFTGNPLLVPSRNHAFDINFNRYQSKNDTYFYSNGRISFDENSVVIKSQISTEGITISSPVNRSGRQDMYMGFGLSKKLKTSKNWQIRLNPYLNFTRFRAFVILNQNEGYQTNLFVSLSQNVLLNWKDVIEITPQYRVGPQKTSYSGINFQSIKYTTHNVSTHYSFRWPKRIYWEGTYNYNYNPLVSPGFQKNTHLLNMSVAKQMLKKDRGELKLSCYDLLNQNIGSFRNTGTNSVYDSQYQILKRYFLLTYMIKFNKTTTK